MPATWYQKMDGYCKRVKRTIAERREDVEGLSLSEPFPGDFIDVVYSHSQNVYTYQGTEKLKDVLYKLQFYAHFNNDPEKIKEAPYICLNIFGKPITFTLTESDSHGKRSRQILFTFCNNGKEERTTYNDIMPQLERHASEELGHVMLKALNSSQSEQTADGLSDETISSASLFILLTHIPEAAVPFADTIDEFERVVLHNTTGEDPKIKDTIKSPSGRIPMCDKIVRSKLRDVKSGTVTFKEAFSEQNFPLRKSGGTKQGRKWVLKDVNGSLTGNLSDTDNEDED